MLQLQLVMMHLIVPMPMSLKREIAGILKYLNILKEYPCYLVLYLHKVGGLGEDGFKKEGSKL